MKPQIHIFPSQSIMIDGCKGKWLASKHIWALFQSKPGTIIAWIIRAIELYCKKLWKHDVSEKYIQLYTTLALCLQSLRTTVHDICRVSPWTEDRDSSHRLKRGRWLQPNIGGICTKPRSTWKSTCIYHTYVTSTYIHIIIWMVTVKVGVNLFPNLV